MIAGIAWDQYPFTGKWGKKPKITYAKTHTTRRNPVTTLAMQVVPLDFIEKKEVLKKYLLVSWLDVAKVVTEYDFFR